MAEEAFDSMGLSEIRLEVFNHNLRAIAAYSRVGFEVTGEHVEWVPRRNTELRVVEMRLSRHTFMGSGGGVAGGAQRKTTIERNRRERQIRRKVRKETRAKRKVERASHQGRAIPDAVGVETVSPSKPIKPD
jgi:hypothetical protein